MQTKTEMEKLVNEGKMTVEQMEEELSWGEGFVINYSKFGSD